MKQFIVSHFSRIAAVLTLCALCALTLAASKPEKAASPIDLNAYASLMSNRITRVEDLINRHYDQQDTFALLIPPGLELLNQPGNPDTIVIDLNSKELTPNLIQALLNIPPVYRNSVPTYEIALQETVQGTIEIRDNADQLLYTDPAPIGYVIPYELLFRQSQNPMLYYPELARYRLKTKLTLLPEHYVEHYLYAQARIAEAAALIQEEEGGGMMLMREGMEGEVYISGMREETNGLQLELSYPEGYSGTVWSAYSYDAQDTLSETFMGLENVWTLISSNIVLTGETSVAWIDTRPLGFDEQTNPVHRFYAFGANTDSDNDGLNDGYELFVTKTNHDDPDSDGDGLNDGWEVQNGLNPDDAADGFADKDGDGWNNTEEYTASSDPSDAGSTPYVTYYVDDTAGQDGFPGTFSEPFKTIQRGLNEAAAGEWVFIKPGTYQGSNNFNLTFAGKSIGLRSLLNEADSVTVDVKSAGRAFIFTSGETTNALVRGLTITGGYAAFGGAIYCVTSSPALRGLHLTGNQAFSNGAAIYLEGASPLISECLIENNTAIEQGAGIYSSARSVLISISPVILKSIGSSPVIERTTFEKNLATEGAAIYHADQAQHYNSVFLRPNHLIGTAKIRRCTIRGNISRNGMVVQNQNSGQLRVENTEVTRNIGGGFGVSQAELEVVNCTVAENEARIPRYSYKLEVNGVTILETNLIAGAAVFSSHVPLSGGYPGNEGFTRVRNSIVWSNKPAVWQIYKLANYGGPSVITQTNLYDLQAASAFFVTAAPPHVTLTGVITNDPQFAGNTYHLRSGSPAIDAAHNGWAPDEDILGQSRPFGVRADLGAEEFVDTDADGLPDWWEVKHSGSATGIPAMSDDDGDNLTNLEEYEAGTDPLDSDGDGDGLSDGDEINVYGTNPAESDTDGDGIPDGWEVANGLDPLDSTDANLDSDGDGLTDYEEYLGGTDPDEWDTDGDGISDGSEVEQQTDPLDPDSTPDAEWFVVTGDLGQGVVKERSRTVVIPSGESRVLIIGVYSEEYPQWTGKSSEFNDVLTWEIQPSEGSAISGSVDVNTRHSDWQQGTNLHGYMPVHIEETRVLSAPTNGALTLQIALSAMNVSDDRLPSTVMVGLSVLKVDLLSGKAVNSPKEFKPAEELDDPCEFAYGSDSQRQDLEELEQKKINSSLTIYFKDASDSQGNVVDFDVMLRVSPTNLQGVTWEKISGPENSGTLIDANKTVATFRNPTKGGKYIFDATLPNGQKVRTQLWLPVSGPDISENFQDEIDYLKNDWGPRYIGNFNARYTALAPPFLDLDPGAVVVFVFNMKIDDILSFALDLDYVLRAYINDICGLAHIAGPNSSAGDRERFSLAGASKKYVIDFAKRSNMGYAMAAAKIGLPDSAILDGPDLYLKWVGNAVGSKDTPAAKESYHAGIDLIKNGKTLSQVMDQRGIAMQESNMRVRKEWPQYDLAQFPYIKLADEAPAYTKQKMEALTISP